MSAFSRLGLDLAKDLFIDLEEVRLRAQVVVDRYATWVFVAGALGLTAGFQVGKRVDQVARLVGRLGR
jgi:hypothetical protein